MDGRRAVGIGAAGGLLVLLAWVTASDHVPMWRESTPTRTTPNRRPAVRDREVTPETLPEPIESDPASFDWSLLGTVLVWVVIAAVLCAVVLIAISLLRRWTSRPHADSSVPLEFEILPEVQETLADVTADPGDLLRRGSPRNAIVDCWVRLCDAVESAGLERDPAETSTELTSRVLATYVLDRHAIDTLAALYREARYSTHEPTEADRQRAIDALAELHAQLQRRTETGAEVT